MLKTTRLPNKLALGKNNNIKLASTRKNDSRLAFKRNIGNNKFNRFSGDNAEHTKKSGKLKG